MKKVGNNVVGVALMTCLIAIIGHLDGGGASTFLITCLLYTSPASS